MPLDPEPALSLGQEVPALPKLQFCKDALRATVKPESRNKKEAITWVWELSSKMTELGTAGSLPPPPKAQKVSLITSKFSKHQLVKHVLQIGISPRCLVPDHFPANPFIPDNTRMSSGRWIFAGTSGRPGKHYSTRALSPHSSLRSQPRAKCASAAAGLRRCSTIQTVGAEMKKKSPFFSQWSQR